MVLLSDRFFHDGLPRPDTQRHFPSYSPMRRTLPSGPDSMGYATELNGIQTQRLKQKLGTRALPTAELELKGVRAYLIGEESRGTKEIATVLNIARTHIV
jgi:alkylation response protein AidB-like acyl-CoA dehydrogenase